MNSLKKIIEELPPEYEHEVIDFIEFLVSKGVKKAHGIPNFKWEGVLKDLREQYTSVDLQHKITELRISGK